VPREPGNREFPEGDNFVPKIQTSWHKFNFNTKKCNGRAQNSLIRPRRMEGRQKRHSISTRPYKIKNGNHETPKFGALSPKIIRRRTPIFSLQAQTPYPPRIAGQERDNQDPVDIGQNRRSNNEGSIGSQGRTNLQFL